MSEPLRFAFRPRNKYMTPTDLARILAAHEFPVDFVYSALRLWLNWTANRPPETVSFNTKAARILAIEAALITGMTGLASFTSILYVNKAVNALSLLKNLGSEVVYGVLAGFRRGKVVQFPMEDEFHSEFLDIPDF